MSKKLIASLREDGGVSLTELTAADPSTMSPEEVQRHLDRISSGLPSPIVRWAVVDEAEIPPEATTARDFRNSLTLGDDGKVVHDISRAKEILRDRIRIGRASVLDDLDRQQMRAFGKRDNDKFDQLEAAKQALRDLPTDPRIDKASTVAELRSLVAVLQDENGISVPNKVALRDRKT